MKRFGVMWLGVVLILAGLAILIERFVPAAGLLELAKRWWPGVLVIIGVLGVVNLRAPLGVARKPSLLVIVGAILLIIVQNPVPDQWRPALLPLALCVLGLAVLVAVARRASEGGSRSVERLLLIGAGRRLTWKFSNPSVLDVRALVSGSIITVSPDALARAGRLEITAIFSDVEVVVPSEWTVYLESHGVASKMPMHIARSVLSASEADLCIHALSVAGSVAIRDGQSKTIL